MDLELECAPLEGITDAVFRRVHARFFPEIDRYYTPFISPTQNHRFTPRELRELAPENNPGLHLIPQLLGKNAADFLWSANALSDMGYDEVNLNLGCPSGTVVAKGKGAGFLDKTDALRAFLEEIFTASPLPISIKTRIGAASPAEFPALLSLYNEYPVHRLIIHARTRAEMYRPGVHLDEFAYALTHTHIPLSYNGDLFTLSDVNAFRHAYSSTCSIMLGRGLIADPGLAQKLHGVTPNATVLRQFHDTLCREYPIVFGSQNSAMHRMKAIWQYLLCSFDGGDAYRKRLIKAKRWEDFLLITDEIFKACPIRSAAKDIP